MVFPSSARNLQRDRGPHAHARVTYIELFFDLVFVFAVTQISHFLLHHLNLMGALESGLLMMAVWWVWVFTSWVTNWVDPDKTPVRVMLLVLMLAGLVLSTSLPKAFVESGLIFACAYVTMQLGRSLFMLYALRAHNENNHRNFLRITSWFAFSAIFWIFGGFMQGHERLLWWGVALLIEYISPAMAFWTPFWGRSKTEEWDVEGGHMSERAALFIIIVLGESILVTGATFAELPWSYESVAAFLVAFLGSVASWWIYFDTGADRGSQSISEASNPGRYARNAYTYIHVLIVAGIIVSAVGDDLVLGHPGQNVTIASLLVILGGSGLFLTGNILFKWVIGTRPPRSHLVGLGLIVALAFAASYLTILSLSAGTSAILMIVAGWESCSIKGKRHAEA